MRIWKICSDSPSGMVKFFSRCCNASLQLPCSNGAR